MPIFPLETHEVKQKRKIKQRQGLEQKVAIEKLDNNDTKHSVTWPTLQIRKKCAVELFICAEYEKKKKRGKRKRKSQHDLTIKWLNTTTRGRDRVVGWLGGPIKTENTWGHSNTSNANHVANFFFTAFSPPPPPLPQSCSPIFVNQVTWPEFFQLSCLQAFFVTWIFWPFERSVGRSGVCGFVGVGGGG